MPYLKHTRDPVRALLKSYDIVDGTKLARILGVTPKTGRARFNYPNTLTIADLKKINKFGHVPIEEIRAVIGKEEK